MDWTDISGAKSMGLGAYLKKGQRTGTKLFSQLVGQWKYSAVGNTEQEENHAFNFRILCLSHCDTMKSVGCIVWSSNDISVTSFRGS